MANLSEMEDRGKRMCMKIQCARELTGQLSELLRDYLMQRYQDKSSRVWVFHTNLYAQSKKFDLMIRILPDINFPGSYRPAYLVIARMGFLVQRKGNGTDLLCILCAFTHTNHIKEIKIESAHSESIKNFAKKHDFTPCGYTIWDGKDCEDNWVIKTTSLTRTLKLTSNLKERIQKI